MNYWTSINESLPPADTLVLVKGRSPEAPQPDPVYAMARLVESWEASEQHGHTVEAWVEDATHDELTFWPTHWQILQLPRH